MNCGWEAVMEKNLLTKKENSAIRSILHSKQCRKNKKTEASLMIVNIILLFVSGILLIIALIVPNISVDYIRMSTVLILTTTFISVIISVILIVGSYGSLAEKHRVASTRYTFLEHCIDNILCINPTFIKNPRGYFLWIMKQYDNIILSSPELRFNREFGEKGTCRDSENGSSPPINARSSTVLSDTSSDVFQNVSVNKTPYDFNRRDIYSHSDVSRAHIVSDREKKDYTYEMDKFILDSYTSEELASVNH